MQKVVKSAPAPADDVREFVMSDGSIDRMGDVIDPAGWDLSSFSAGNQFNPIALFNHKPDQVVGSWRNVQVRRGQLVGKFEPLEPGTSELADSVRKMIDQDVLRAVSVGFDPVEKEPLTDKASPHFGPWRFKKQILLECSIVSVPANPNAVAIARSMNLSNQTVAVLFGEQAGKPATPNGKPARLELAPRAAKMNLSQTIESHQSQLNTMRDRQTEILNDEEKDLDARTQEAADLSDQIDAVNKSLENLRKIERTQGLSGTGTALAVVPQNVQNLSPIGSPAIMHKNMVRPIERKADLLIRKATIQLLAHIHHRHPEELLRDLYGNDEQTGIVLRTAQVPATTTGTGWAVELVQTATADFVDTLKADRIYPQLSRLGLKFNFGRNGIVKFPARASTPTLAGDWILEGEAIPVKQMGFTSVSLTPKKLAVISTFTREIAQHSTPAIEGMIRDAMADDTALVIDTALVSAIAATTAKPAGLLTGISALTPSASANPVTAMIADISALINAITAVNGGRQLVLMVNPAQAFSMGLVQTTTGDFLFGSMEEAGRRLGVTVIKSTTVPARTVILVDAVDFASATGDAPEYDVSDQATLHMENVAPLPIVGGTATPPLIASVAAPVRSLFQTASIGVRFLLDMNWAMRRTGMVAWTQNVLW